MDRQRSSHWRQVETYHVTCAHAYAVERSVWQFDTLCLLPRGCSQSWSKTACLGVSMFAPVPECVCICASVCAHLWTPAKDKIITIVLGNKNFIWQLWKMNHKNVWEHTHIHTPSLTHLGLGCNGGKKRCRWESGSEGETNDGWQIERHPFVTRKYFMAN